jgi:DmsE family decaheme c-type cytochrome
MKSPAKLSAREEGVLCATCHQTSHQQNMVERNVHMASDISCSACHSVHESKAPVLLKAAEKSLCVDCHRGVEGAFAKPYRHPVNEGIVKCSDCHSTLSETRRELSLNGTNMCMKCHGEFEGPFPYEHQATVDYSTEEGGCVSCHEPHGSYLPRMVRQPYEAPHFQLCTQCHAVPPRHNANLQHGTAWAGLSCSECHTDIHGSYSNRLFLSETLVGQGCFTAGCHQP